MSNFVKQVSYATLRATCTSADTNLTTITSTWATFLSSYHPDLASPTVRAIRIPSQCSEVDIIFDFETADTDTAAFSLYAYREGGDAELVCAIDTITAGAMKTNDGTARYYADTIGTVTSTWPSTITESDSAAGNRMAKLTFATRGYKYLLGLFTTIGAGSARAKYGWF